MSGALGSGPSRVLAGVIGVVAMLAGGALAGGWWWLPALAGAGAAGCAIVDRQFLHPQVLATLALAVGLGATTNLWFVPLLVAGTIGSAELAAAAERTTSVRRQVPGLPAVVTATVGSAILAGVVLVRQRPGSAKGVVFMTLEDETGIANVVIRPALFDRQARIVTNAPVLYVEGTLERRDGVVNVIAQTLKPVRGLPLS